MVYLSIQQQRYYSIPTQCMNSRCSAYQRRDTTVKLGAKEADNRMWYLVRYCCDGAGRIVSMQHGQLLGISLLYMPLLPASPLYYIRKLHLEG
jgi:hypothetical protein